MNVKSKFRSLIALVLILQLIVLPFHTAAANKPDAPMWAAPIDYLALGDSLAYGIHSNGEPGEGYADFLAQTLDASQALQSSNKGFSVPGYKSVDVLRDLRENAVKPILGTGHVTAETDLHSAIAEADLITLTVGANDVLPYFKINPETGVPDFDLEQLSAAIQQVGANVHEILKRIYKINPNVQVFVMGYYNPFPHLDGAVQPQIEQLLSGLNQAIQAGLQGTEAVFVPTSEQIAQDYQAHLPNPENIHLSEAGYRIVSQAFSEQLAAHYKWLDDDVLTAEAAGDNTAVLRWKPVLNPESVVGYVVYNGEEAVGQVAGDVTSFTVEGLQPGDYTFSIVALGDEGAASTLNPKVSLTIGAVDRPAFTDVQGHWAQPYIEQAAGKGIVHGNANGTFQPDRPLTRAQAASLLSRAFGLKSANAAPFKDLADYADVTKAEIAATYEYGIVKGTNGKFRPNEPVTRAQMALMINRLYEAAKGQPYKAKNPAPFTDIHAYDKEAQDAAAMLYELEIASGSQGKFMPGNAATRAHAVKMVMNTLELLE